MDMISSFKLCGRMTDTICDLLQTPFSQLPCEKKREMVLNGRPKPELPSLKLQHVEKNRSYIRSFKVTNYEKYTWLTGSPQMNKLFCWPCVLFSNEIGPWNTTGFSSLTYLITACDKHQKSVNHIKAFTALQTFGRQKIDHTLDMQRKMYQDLHNAEVKENRTILRYLIDVVTFLGKQEYAFRDHESEESPNMRMYVELLQFLASYDTTLANHLKRGTIFKGTSPVVQNDLIDAVAAVISDKIKSEIIETAFVTIMLDECTDVTNKSQLSTSLRYVDAEGNCQERFLHFTDVSFNRTAQGLFLHVSQVIDDFGCSNKLICQTFDGAAVMASHVSDLQTLVKNKYPAACFLHSCSHRLNLVLSQSVTFIKECKYFFVSLAGIHTFFSHSVHRTVALKNFLERTFPELAPTRWNFSSHLVNTVMDCRKQLISFFLSIEDEPGDWTSVEVNTASGLVVFLSKFDTVFFLNIFHRIFAYADVLFETLQTKCLDLSYCSFEVEEFYEILGKMRNDDFDKIWAESTTPDQDEEYEPMQKSRRKDDHNDCKKYLLIFNEILDTIMAQMKHRYETHKSLQFVSLLDSNRFNKFCKIFPQDLLMELKEPYVRYFDTVLLKNELKVFYALDDFKNKSVTDIVRYMKLNSLDVVYSEVYKLGQLILSFPSTTVAVERNFSVLKRIKSYLYATQGQVHLRNLALLSIEKTLLMDIKKDSEESFFENVTLKFAQKERKMQFMYK